MKPGPGNRAAEAAEVAGVAVEVVTVIVEEADRVTAVAASRGIDPQFCLACQVCPRADFATLFRADTPCDCSGSLRNHEQRRTNRTGRDHSDGATRHHVSSETGQPTRTVGSS